MPSPVEVEILGHTFSVTSEDGEDHIRRVAGVVDQRMREVAAEGRVVSSFTTAVLAALNIASECQKLQQDFATMQEAIDRLAQRLAAHPGPDADES